MFSLVIKKTEIVYLFGTIFTLLFGLIYEIFSHGVFSNYMLFAFCIPLVGGAILLILRESDYRFLNYFHCMILSFTIGSILNGFLEIYGTTNSNIMCYLYIGCMFFLFSFFRYIKLRVHM